MVSIDTGAEYNQEQHQRQTTIALRMSIGALVAAVGLVSWIVQMHANVSFMQGQVTALSGRLDNMDIAGTRVVPQINQHINQMELRITRNDGRLDEILNRTIPSLQTRDEIVSASMKRIEEQQTRILQALDNTYNLLQEHLRTAHPRDPDRR